MIRNMISREPDRFKIAEVGEVQIGRNFRERLRNVFCDVIIITSM